MRIRPKQARKLWVKALRSGKFTQCKGRLCEVKNSKEKHCCLGVACEVYNKYHTKKLSVKVYDMSKYFDDESSVLPEKVVKWLGLADKYAGLNNIVDNYHNSISDCLVSLNDDKGKNFKFIAQVIENGEVKLVK